MSGSMAEYVDDMHLASIYIAMVEHSNLEGAVKFSSGSLYNSPTL